MRKIKVKVDDMDVEVGVIRNSLGDIQEIINEIEKLKKEKPQLYDLLGEIVYLITETSIREIPYTLGMFIKDILKESSARVIEFEHEDENVTIAVKTMDVLYMVDDGEKIRAFVLATSTDIAEMVAKALVVLKITGGW